MHATTPDWLLETLVCPSCKGSLRPADDSIVCLACGHALNWIPPTGNGQHRFLDARVRYPAWCVPPGQRAWADTQASYERNQRHKLDSYPERFYQDRLEGFRHIYENEMRLSGRVLDVGGSLGLIRQYLSEQERLAYVNLDPFPEVFHGLQKRTALRSVFPVVSEPCPFLAGEAERLPFPARSFDVVHMRAVIDHLADPYIALHEARRVLRQDGRLIIGSIVSGGESSYPGRGAGARRHAASLLRRVNRKVRTGGVGELARSAWRHATNNDPHLYHWTTESLAMTLHSAGFRVDATAWLRPPLDMVLYVAASPGPAAELMTPSSQSLQPRPPQQSKERPS